MRQEPHSATTPMPVFIDTDVGCDDALAIAWLLRRPEVKVVGMSSVFGNSSVQNTTANLLTLLDALGREAPVTMGASAPLVYPRTSAGALTHGPDGLWGAQRPHDLETLPAGAPGAIAAAARAHPGLTIIALGPLTNIARAVQAYPEDLVGVRLVALAGAHGAGSITPAAEFNAFADPHALALVLESSLHVELVTRDAFRALELDRTFAMRLQHEGGAVGRFLGQIFESYARAVNRQMAPVPVPDAAAAIYAVHPDLGVAVPATVRVVTEGELTRGQTIIALSEQHQAMLALGTHGVEHLAMNVTAPDFDYLEALRQASARAPRNAQVVLEIDARTMAEMLEAGLMEWGMERAVGR
ncbi:MAG: nucleoside hydrolase [Oscillochloridaceae bacterium]|nr:nucleoside hydrolase [Chloroflexaceae bacterium]MDW8391705.1 nucleoside hydrolase [Oscillochloridaceae bacterium]